MQFMETESLDEYFNKMIPLSYDETARHIAYAAVRVFIAGNPRMLCRHLSGGQDITKHYKPIWRRRDIG